MRWISNNDPPLYIWEGDLWYNQKDKITYFADIHMKRWIIGLSLKSIDFPKKTRIMNERRK